VQRLLESEAFARSWTLSKEPVRSQVLSWLYLGSLTLLEKWINKCRLEDLETMSLRQLRDRAKGFNVPYYGRLTKIELIWEINHALETPNDLRVDNNAVQNGIPCLGMGKNSKEEVFHQV